MDLLKHRIVGVFLSALGILALQLPAQAQTTLIPAAPVGGTVAAGAPQSWSFDARDGEVLSFLVQSAGSLDPVLTISNADGVVLITNDDYDYPTNRDSLLEAITFPRTGTYTATISAFGSATGDYTLTMLPGYTQIAYSEDFAEAGTWRTADESALQTTASDGLLTLSVAGIGSEGVARSSSQPELQDYYAQIAVTNVSSSAGWRVGMTVRHQNLANYYAVLVNSDGFWRFVVRTSQGETVLRDWSSHPAIVAGETAFTMGMLVVGANFEFYYNKQYVGQIVDTTFSFGGQTGLFIGAAEALDAEASAQFDDLLLTMPFQMSNGAGVFPQQLMGGSPQAAVQELQRRRLIPTQGDMTLVVEESFGQAVRPGVSRFPLGRDLTFTNMVYGAAVEIQAQAAGTTGCGLVLRNVSDTDYTVAYIDQTGGYGLAQRVSDAFQPGLFGQNPAFTENPHDLLVIVNGDILYYYVDKQHVGMLTLPLVEGSVGNAVVNFEPIDTTCQFNDTWLWRWDN
jgi:hypothetical protein